MRYRRVHARKENGVDSHVPEATKKHENNVRWSATCEGCPEEGGMGWRGGGVMVYKKKKDELLRGGAGNGKKSKMKVRNKRKSS